MKPIDSKNMLKSKLSILQDAKLLDIGMAGGMIWVIFNSNNQYSLHISNAFLIIKDGNKNLFANDLDSAEENSKALDNIKSNLLNQTIRSIRFNSYYDIEFKLSNSLKFKIYANISKYEGPELELWRLFVKGDLLTHLVVTTNGMEGSSLL